LPVINVNAVNAAAAIVLNCQPLVM